MFHLHGNFTAGNLEISRLKNLNISRYTEFDSVAENKTDPTLKAIFKYKDHPSILEIKSDCEKETFRFSQVNTEDIKKGILKLD